MYFKTSWVQQDVDERPCETSDAILQTTAQTAAQNRTGNLYTFYWYLTLFQTA